MEINICRTNEVDNYEMLLEPGEQPGKYCIKFYSKYFF